VAEADAVDQAVDVAALQQSLETAIAQESILQRKVEGLESDLAQQRDLVKSLKADVRAVSKLQKELDEAKTMIRKLTQLNANEPQQDSSPESPAEKKAPAETSSPTPSAPPASPASTAAMQLRRVLQSPVFPDAPSTQFTDDDIGWFD
jgi:chromosome segregation ATPase